jgi:NADH:quinone reductase (non-electrogenic)
VAGTRIANRMLRSASRSSLHPDSALADGSKVAIVVGAGFAGLNAARKLANRANLRVVLIDHRNHHLFQPLLYQVATAGLNPADIAVPIRVQFRHAENVEIHLRHVEGVNLQRQTIFGEGHEIPFDYLILACGARHTYFGHPEWEEFAPGLKTLEQATEMRRRMLIAFEKAENELDPVTQQAHLTFVVVGGGPTGVELAGAIADISRTAMRGDFRRIDPTRSHIVLVEAAPRVLTTFSNELSERARHDLVELGVEVRTNAKVEAIDAQGVTIGGKPLSARTVFWAAGVQAERLHIIPDLETDRASRIRVDSDCSVPGYSNVFVVGDMASFEISPGTLLPGVAPAAIQSGEHAAEMILGDLVGEPRRPFRYRDKGTMATIGKSRAVAQIGRLALTGRIAWFTWLLVHVFSLIGFRNRVSVLFGWAWAYLFSKREARLITEKEWRLRN